MAYTVTESKSWFTRIKESFGGITTGIVLILIATWLLWWNEERTFKTAGAIGEAELVTQDVQDISRIDPSLSGKVIHATGRADTQEVIRDSVFGVKTQAINIRRKAEYFQWQEHSSKETRKKLGGGEETVTTYTYSTGWTHSPVNSANFADPSYRNSNTIITEIKDETQWAGRVTFGAYELPDFLKKSITGDSPLILDSLDVTSPIGVDRDIVHIQGSTVYIGWDPSNPQIGDVRVTFTQLLPADVSLIAQVDGNTFKPFTASNGYTFSSLVMGRKESSEMFEGARSGNKIIAWVLRVIGVLCVVGGLKMILRPLSVIADVIPILGTIVGGGTGFVAFLLGLAWSLLVVAVAWVRFRPLLAGGLVAGALLLLVLSFMRGKKAAQA